MFILKSNFLVGCLFKEGNELSRAYIYKFGKNIWRSTQDNQVIKYTHFSWQYKEQEMSYKISVKNKI